MNDEFMSKFEKLLEDVAMIKEMCRMCTEWGSLKEVTAIRSNSEQNCLQINALVKENKELKVRLNDLDQYSGECNVVIQCVPYKEN